ncbi:MAG: hypothetical protein AAF066_11200 [Pseudomonadota bacterium]
MRMSLDEAKTECRRWFAYLERQEQKTRDLQKLAADRRAGKCDDVEMKRRRAAIDEPGVTVYDGANLYDAVKTLLKHVEA